MDKDCIFCKLSRNKIPRKTIYENSGFFSVPDVNPRTNGHSLIISKRHCKTILDMPKDSGESFIDCVKNTWLKLTSKENFSGFNILNNNFESAGQVVNHVHFHIFPRKKGDNFNISG